MSYTLVKYTSLRISLSAEITAISSRLPVSTYLIEHPKGRILVDTGWHREMSPEGVYDRKAQINSLGSWQLYMVNQGRIARGQAIDEQLSKMGMKPSDIDYVLLTHLDCDHANGLTQLKGAKHILVARDEMGNITSGVCQDKKLQRQSLQWIREQSMLPECVESLANHDTDIKPHIIEL